MSCNVPYLFVLFRGKVTTIKRSMVAGFCLPKLPDEVFALQHHLEEGRREKGRGEKMIEGTSSAIL